MSLSFDPEAVRALANILVDTGLTEIEFEGEGGRIRLVRAHAPVAAAVAHAHAPAMPMVPVVVAPAAAPQPTEDIAHHPGVVLSPMVGVAYLAPEPGAAPFVSLGQTVSAGQTLLLIEAMKTFNQIKAPKSGTVTRILVAAGAPVEFDEPLMIVE